MSVLPPRPITKQETIMAGVLGLIIPGAGAVMALIALLMARRDGNTKIVALMAALIVWNVALFVGFLALAT